MRESYDPTQIASTDVLTADRVTITTATGAPLATGVGIVKFDFTNPSGENGWSGYSEIQLFAALGIYSATHTGGNLSLVGAGGTPGAGYTWLSTTNVAIPLSAWATNSTGGFDGNGGFSNSIPIVPSHAKRFFQLRIP